jgi:hypothetical protein
MPIDPETLEGRIDKVAAGATEISMGFGGVQFRTMMELMEFAKLMAVSGAAVPVHLRGNPGACLAVCTKALRFGFDPFSLAEHSYAMEKNVKNENNQWEKVETIAYDSFVISAIINAHAPITGNIDFTYSGEAEERKCKAFAVKRGTDKLLEHESPTLGELKRARGYNDKGQIKGSQLWSGPKSDQQLAYDTRRDFCRKHFPEILLGWYDKDEFDEEVRAQTAKDITPAASPLKERLKAGAKDGAAGFSQAHVEKALTHQPGTPVPEAAADRQPDPVPVADANAPAAESQMELTAGDVETEIAQKKRAMDNVDTLDDHAAIVAETTAFLKSAKRTDLLADFLSHAKKRGDKLAKKAA